VNQGKLKGMKVLADERGVIRAAAMDQRGSLRNALAAAKSEEPEAISDEMLAEFKTAVIKVLSPYASAVLLDPEYGLSASKERPSGVGLLLAYEKSGYDNTKPGRFPLLLENWSVKKLQEAGADGVKLLLYYNPFDEASLNEGKKAFVQRVGAECAHLDIPFFLEFVGYDPSGQASPLEYARKKPEIVTQSMREFSRDLYKVDVLKVEIPVNLQYTSGTNAFQGPQAAYSREEAKELYRKAAGAARRPFIYLSGGVDDREFREGLALGIEAKVNFAGVLCGRATWKDGIAVYAGQGLSALEDWLGDRAIQNIQALNEILAGAHSWQDFS